MAWGIASRLTGRLAQARPLRSLTVRLTLAFLLVGLLGVLTVALLVGLRTRTEFDRFLSARDQAYLVDALRAHYQAAGGWADVEDLLEGDPRLDLYSRAITLADADGVVVLSRLSARPGDRLDAAALAGGQPIQIGGRTVGTVVFSTPRPDPSARPRPEPPATAFLERVAGATAASAGVALLFALLLGALLARGMTRSVRELTEATRAMARGELGHQVQVRSRDDIGELASSFNQMSADLAGATRMRRQMTADLAHDLRTPLSILRGYTEGLKDERLAGGPAIFAIMHSEVEHLQRMVEELRLLSLADAGELTLNRRAVDPRALLERAGLAHIVQAERQGLALRIEADEALPSVLVDTDRMAQVLNNLVANALRHTTSGEVRLSAGAEGGAIVLRVADTGEGIDPDDLPQIFERFYRADKARQRGDGAESGLGLAIARAIVVAHGGSIAAESQPGRGAVFSIRLPAETPAPPAVR